MIGISAVIENIRNFERFQGIMDLEYGMNGCEYLVRIFHLSSMSSIKIDYKLRSQPSIRDQIRLLGFVDRLNREIGSEIFAFSTGSYYRNYGDEIPSIRIYSHGIPLEKIDILVKHLKNIEDVIREINKTQ